MPDDLNKQIATQRTGGLLTPKATLTGLRQRPIGAIKPVQPAMPAQMRPLRSPAAPMAPLKT